MPQKRTKYPKNQQLTLYQLKITIFDQKIPNRSTKLYLLGCRIGFSDQKVTHKCGLKITHLMVNKKDPNGSNCFSNISPKTLF